MNAPAGATASVGQETPLSTGMLLAWAVVGAIAIAIPVLTLTQAGRTAAEPRRSRRGP